ncbi:PadR family transcriptional regulator [Spirillospora sp. NPDC000708]|uniref:PadR family transcriptional regulator n=1 Tax=Actinomadura nitritigenes TaxID=134602 RepID=UPI00335B5F39
MGGVRPTPAQFSILLTLAQGEMHGYAIMKAVGEEQGPRLGPGTLYRSIKQLLDAGLIAEAGDRPDPDSADDQRRRYYRLTGTGRQLAQAEAARLDRLIDRARSVGLLPPMRPRHA